MGTNAIRTAHNPPAPELLDLADRMGFLVMDEAFDVWEQGKDPAYDYHLYFDDWAQRDLQAMVRRDRNHPSVDHVEHRERNRRRDGRHRDQAAGLGQGPRYDAPGDLGRQQHEE